VSRDGDHPVNDRRFSIGDTGWPVAIAPALVVLVLGAFLIFATDSEPRGRFEQRRSPVEAPAVGAQEGAWVTAVDAKQLGDAPIVAAAHDPHDAWMHPHALTPEHQRVQAESEVIRNLNDAMALRDVPKMRELIVALRALGPNDTDRAQLGYGVIADCIEHPGAASLARAKDFYASQRHSPLRRFVRRICFEKRD
jgi:hypothetical protein